MIDSPLFGLLLLAILAATPLVLRRLKTATPDGLRVIGRTALHRNAVVAVVAIGERRLVVGAGERGVQLLAELDPETAHGGVPVPIDDATVDRTDAVAAVGRHDPTTEALEGLLGPPGSAGSHPGPGIGLLDRLRAMTVRVPPPSSSVPAGPGRAIHVPLRR